MLLFGFLNAQQTQRAQHAERATGNATRMRTDSDLQGWEGIPGKGHGGYEGYVIKLAKSLSKCTYPQFSPNNGYLWGRKRVGLELDGAY